MQDYTTNDSPKLCECGCGEPTPLATRTKTGRGQFKGQYLRFKTGHHKHPPVEQRFWSKVDKRGPDECWEWLGGGGKGKHGRFGADGAHRFSYELHYGPIPEGMHVCHHCDNPPCVNPSHLFVGTSGDNTRDKLHKGRGNNPKGEKHWQAKFTAQDIQHIRERVAQGEQQTILAQEYGVSLAGINAIIRRRTWKHL